MKKFGLLLLIGFIFLLGIQMGGKYTGSSHLFEESKNDFESQITNPDNHYEAKNLKPKEGILNTVAHTIDGFIEKIANKIS